MSNTIKGFRGKDGPILLDYSGVTNVPGAVESIAGMAATVGDQFEVASVDDTGKVATVRAIRTNVKSVGGVGPDSAGNVPLEWVPILDEVPNKNAELLAPTTVDGAEPNKLSSIKDANGLLHAAFTQEELAVTFDGKLYLRKPFTGYDTSDAAPYHWFIVGNPSLVPMFGVLAGNEDTGEPFAILGLSDTGTDGNADRIYLCVTEAGTYEVSVYGDGLEYVPRRMPEEFLPETFRPEGVELVDSVTSERHVVRMADGRLTVDGEAVSCSGENAGRLYVEDYKNDHNTWNEAFDALFAECLANGFVACTGGSYYELTAPLYIGDIDVDFESCELYNNVAESETNPACVVLTGAEKRVQKFGTVTGRQSIGILINTAGGLYKYNHVYAKLIQGYSHALCISTTNYTCCFNRFYCLLLKSAVNPLKTYSASRLTKWTNECYFYLGAIEGYRSTIPTLLISMTNATRCNIYDVDLECGDYKTPDPEHTVEVELTDCSYNAFINPRTSEGFNAVQFRFFGECYANYIDAEYSKFRPIDSSRMVKSDAHYNVWRGRAVTGNSGSVTNAHNLRIYNGLVVPETITPMVRNVSEDLVVSQSLLDNPMDIAAGNSNMAGVPTLLKWSAGNITIDKRFIALLPAVIQIMRVADTVGDILDTDGNVILPGSELELNKRLDIRVDSATYGVTPPTGENEKQYPYFHAISLAIGDYAEPPAEEWTPAQTVAHEFVDGFVRTAGTINTTSTNYKYTGLVEYKGGSVDFRAISNSTGVSCAIVAFFDSGQTFLGSLETAVGGQEAFYGAYNTGEYAAISGADIGADVMGGTITAEQIAEWYPGTAYIAVSCPISPSEQIKQVYDAVTVPYLARQTY